MDGDDGVKHRKKRGGNTNLRPAWQPGQSGNPNGRPKKAQQVVDKAQANADKALDALVKLIGSDDEKIRLQAAMAVLDRAVGKPKQTVETNAKTEVTDYSVDELRTIAGMGSPRAVEAETGAGQPRLIQ